MTAIFYDDEIRRVYEGNTSTAFPPDIQQVVRRKLRMIAAAIHINDLRQPPGNRLEKLAGNREGQYSVRVNDQWRLCFVWQDGAAHQSELTKHSA